MYGETRRQKENIFRGKNNGAEYRWSWKREKQILQIIYPSFDRERERKKI
jgi:hypothetical protein